MKQSFLARRRVALGFPLALAALFFAAPTVHSIVLGAGIAIVGQAIRLWAAGHLEKSREVTASGPYRFTRHPLYLGSSIMGLGVMVACQSVAVAILIGSYLALTISSAIRSEEAFLRERFGAAYDDYAHSRGPRVVRRFSWERAWRNKEYRAPTGLLLLLLLLIGRMYVVPYPYVGGGIGAISAGPADTLVELFLMLGVAAVVGGVLWLVDRLRAQTPGK
jgi:hypothetical protein